MSSKKYSADEVLRYGQTGPAQATVRRHYLRWRKQQNPALPVRCDNPECHFHTNPLIWNGKPFKPILDHQDGNNTDNRPGMLWLLCPICDAQLITRGGANKGRIEKSLGGFAKVSKEGKRDYTLFAEPGDFSAGDGANRDTGDGSGQGFWPLDIRDLRFDNDLVVAGGIIATECLTWRVPEDPYASHTIGSRRVSMSLVAVNA